MATQEARAWTYTSGYPATLKVSTIHPPTASILKSNGGYSHASGIPRLLVKIHACALNPVDIQMMNLAEWKKPWSGLYNVEKGCVCDFSGTLLAASGTKELKSGDEVFGLTLKPYAPDGGALAEIADLSLHNTVAVKKPAGWSHEKAAAISLVWLTAKACVESVAEWVEKSKNKRVAVLGGSSATGIYIILLAKRKGWKVITTSSARNKDFLAADLKADEHVDYTSQNVREAVSTFAPDAVIDCVGGTGCIGLPSSKRYITIVGDKTGRTTMGGPYTYWDYLAPHRMALQWLRWVKGYVGLGESYDVVILGMRSEWLEEAKETLTPDDIYVDSTFAFEDAKAAFERLNTGRARGKVVVSVAG